MTAGRALALGTPPNPATASLEDLRAWFESCLPEVMSPPEAEPRELHDAMAYACEAGKRVRPLLCLAACAACAGDLKDAFPAAAAVEFVHAYSLVHDDLPAMDDDVTRRGRPTVHVRFGEALAILAGDALLTLAFGVLAGGGEAEARLAMSRELAMAAGSLGMVGGQSVDIAAASGGRDPESLARYIAEHKTGALMRTACRLGGLAAAAPSGLLGLLTRFGATFGFAYQVLDDIGDEARDLQRGAALNFALLQGREAAAETAASAIGAAATALAQGRWPGPTRWLEMIVVELCRHNAAS
ncbi:MAG: polyprenyl synthetase family protein [Bacillota bacterium]|nr:polyprenyl synthetase family protein [Bacillota bacterium]